jgi:phytoene dehydrogenase-like protein
MRRRNFVLGAAALAAGGGGIYWQGQHIRATARYPGREAGHRLRDTLTWPEPTETYDTDVLIAGSGVAGLTAAWQLGKRGIKDLMLLSGPEPQGNAACGRDGDLSFPTGAHYLPLPSMESRHIREMLADFGVIQGDPYALRPWFDERYLVHGPAERVLFENAWEEGYLPSERVSAAERADHQRFFALVEQYASALGSDGRRAFAVPLELSSSDPRYRRLDTQSFAAWLDAQNLRSPTLRWYLDYCCRDDYGRHDQEISAWAGLHYFCGRGGLAANADRGAVLTWPEGLSALATRLERAQPKGFSLRAASVARLRTTANGIEALCVRAQNGEPRSFRVRARQGIAAMPLFVLAHVLEDGPRYGFEARRDLPEYAPWIVSNFVLHAFPEEQPGSPLSWDNVVYREPGLGYVVSTHQDIRMSLPRRTAFTAYYALSELSPTAGRQWLDGATLAQLTELAARDLRLAYGWRLPLCVERVDITIRAHAMAIPHPGFLSRPGIAALRGSDGPLYFAHSDLSGLSLFEEAAHWGYRAAERIAATRTP